MKRAAAPAGRKKKRQKAPVKLAVGSDQLSAFNGRVGLRNKWLVNRTAGQIVQNVTLTYDGRTLEFAERFPVSRKAKFDSLSISQDDLATPGEYKLETQAWFAGGDAAKAAVKDIPSRGTVNVDWWGNTYGRLGHVQLPADADVLHRSLHMSWDGGGMFPHISKQEGF